MTGVIELKPEFATVSRASLFDGDDGLQEQKNALMSLSDRCRNRGLSDSVRNEVKFIDSMAKENQTLTSSKDASDGRGDRFRHGSYLDRNYMDVDDFTAYYAQCRSRNLQHQVTVEGSAPVDASAASEAASNSLASLARSEAASANTEGAEAPMEAVECAAASVGQAPRREGVLVRRASALAKEWLEPDDRLLRKSGTSRRMPMSLIASFVVIAISLMLIVSGSVMVANAKRQVSNLRDEVEVLAEQAQVLGDKLEATTDYLEIYRVATEEYGMVDAGYVNSSYLNAGAENRIEAYATEEEATFGLSTLLSAIGIHIGENGQ